MAFRQLPSCTARSHAQNKKPITKRDGFGLPYDQITTCYGSTDSVDELRVLVRGADSFGGLRRCSGG